jgi:hypothetical protein
MVLGDSPRFDRLRDMEAMRRLIDDFVAWSFNAHKHSKEQA